MTPLPRKLSFYLARRFAVWLGLATLGCMVLAVLGDYLEMLRFVGKFDQPTSLALTLTLLHLPSLLIGFLPFIFLFATVICLTRLSEARELVVIRAAGLSFRQFLAPFILVGGVASIVTICVIDPLGAYGFRREQEIRAALGPLAQNIVVSQNGLWLRETNANGELILRAAQVDETDNSLTLRDVMALQFGIAGDLRARITAPLAQLKTGIWVFPQARYETTASPAKSIIDLRLPTAITLDDLRHHSEPAKAMAVWTLPAYIDKARETGTEIREHIARFHELLALPIFLLAMILVGAMFSLPRGRSFASARALTAGIGAGIAVYLFEAFIGKLSLIGTLPAALAAWTPPLICLLIAFSVLLYTEDG